MDSTRHLIHSIAYYRRLFPETFFRAIELPIGQVAKAVGFKLLKEGELKSSDEFITLVNEVIDTCFSRVWVSKMEFNVQHGNTETLSDAFVFDVLEIIKSGQERQQSLAIEFLKRTISEIPLYVKVPSLCCISFRLIYNSSVPASFQPKSFMDATCSVSPCMDTQGDLGLDEEFSTLFCAKTDMRGGNTCHMELFQPFKYQKCVKSTSLDEVTNIPNPCVSTIFQTCECGNLDLMQIQCVTCGRRLHLMCYGRLYTRRKTGRKCITCEYPRVSSKVRTRFLRLRYMYNHFQTSNLFPIMTDPCTIFRFSFSESSGEAELASLWSQLFADKVLVLDRYPNYVPRTEVFKYGSGVFRYWINGIVAFDCDGRLAQQNIDYFCSFKALTLEARDEILMQTWKLYTDSPTLTRDMVEHLTSRIDSPTKGILQVKDSQEPIRTQELPSCVTTRSMDPKPNLNTCTESFATDDYSAMLTPQALSPACRTLEKKRVASPSARNSSKLCLRRMSFEDSMRYMRQTQ